jgi:steroid delta-isomerase
VSAEALAGLKAFWEGLTPERLAAIDAVYAPEAYFRDPFNEVRGIAELRRIFGHMYDTLEEPRFAIAETILEGDRAVLIWDFDFRIKAWQPGVTRRIHGLSVVRFGPDGRVTWHRDYWDAAGELYAQLPVVGPLMRFLATKMA